MNCCNGLALFSISSLATVGWIATTSLFCAKLKLGTSAARAKASTRCWRKYRFIAGSFSLDLDNYLYYKMVV